MSDSDRLREAERLTHIGSWELDLATGTLYWSEELRRIFGVDQAFVPTYDAWLERIHPDDRGYVDRIARQAVAEKGTYELHHRVVWADGSVRILHCHGVARATSAMGTAQDITEREALAARLTESVRQREEFLMIASHELRTPLASLQLAAQGLLSVLPPDEDAAQQLARSIEKSSKRMAALTEQLLTMGLIHDARPIGLDRKPVDLSEIVRQTVQQFADVFTRSGCQLTVDAALPVLGEWDPSRLEQVVVNLLSNATKFAAGKAVHVSVSERDGRALLVVADQGIGIDPMTIGRVWEPFERGVSADHYGGFGLGLYIVRQIVEAHRGTVSVESKHNAGATFTVALPFR